MRDIVARLADVLVDLNSTMQTVSENETVEFDVDTRLNVLEVAVDDLNAVVENVIDFSSDTAEK